MVLGEILTTGIGTPLVVAWISDQLPKKGESLSEVNKKLRNIGLSIIAGIAISSIVLLASKPIATAIFAKPAYADIVKVD